MMVIMHPKSMMLFASKSMMVFESKIGMVFIEAAPSGENQTMHEASRKNLYYKNKCTLTCGQAQVRASKIYDGV
jgi:hypothetical protein